MRVAWDNRACNRVKFCPLVRPDFFSFKRCPNAPVDLRTPFGLSVARLIGEKMGQILSAPVTTQLLERQGNELYRIGVAFARPATECARSGRFYLDLKRIAPPFVPLLGFVRHARVPA